MSFSDCERCWNTPCECGLAGYLVIRPEHEFLSLLKNLPATDRERIVNRLEQVMGEELRKLT